MGLRDRIGRVFKEIGERIEPRRQAGFPAPEPEFEMVFSLTAEGGGMALRGPSPRPPPPPPTPPLEGSWEDRIARARAGVRS